MGFLKPKPATNSSESYNKNFDLINSTYTPLAQQGVGATNFLGGLLGVPGGDAAGSSAGFENYKSMAGFAPALAALQKGVTGGMAAKGLLRSGATSNALLKKGADLDSSYFQNYFGNLLGLSGQGLQAGGLLTNAGQYNKSEGTGGSPSTAGAIGSLVGGIAGIFSDRRLKRDIVLLDRADDGLGLYAFRMIDDPERRIGVMADEVAAIRPWALGAEVGGFKTVHYGAL